MLTGQIALITGASRGIGWAILQELGGLKATVVGTATTAEGAAKIQNSLDQAGVAGCGAVLDVTDASACTALIGEIEQKYGSVSILVNNAGITRDNLSMRMRDEDWDSVIDTNLKATFRMCRLVMRGMMKARLGRIINITSVVGSSGNPGQANYAAAKAGVAGMTRSLAQELGSRNITVNCIAPGSIDTDMIKTMSEAQHKALLERIPLGRLGQAEEIAAAVAFFASPRAGYVTGATLHINGGLYMA